MEVPKESFNMRISWPKFVYTSAIKSHNVKFCKDTPLLWCLAALFAINTSKGSSINPITYSHNMCFATECVSPHARLLVRGKVNKCRVGVTHCCNVKKDLIKMEYMCVHFHIQVCTFHKFRRHMSRRVAGDIIYVCGLYDYII